MDYPSNLQDQSSVPLGVCVLTAEGMAAIAGVALWGKGARDILCRLFNKAVPDCGRLAYGTLQDGDTVIDSVILACESPGCFVIHCHGNPLLVEHIVRLCRRHGAGLIPSERYLAGHLHAVAKTLIEVEARSAMVRSATLEAVELLAGQITGGLTRWVAGWIDSTSFDLSRLKKECEAILRRGRSAGYLIGGIRIALIGRPNSGKSTLLNWLAGENAALVSDTAGTTRDWVSTTCRIGPLRAELIDTAGLDATLIEGSVVDKYAQESVVEMATSCDLVLNVCDCMCPQIRQASVFGRIPALTVFTKSDLLAVKQPFLPRTTESWVQVSAAANNGLEELSRAILATLHIDSLTGRPPVCFTPRQHDLLVKISQADSESSAKTELRRLIRSDLSFPEGGLPAH